MTSYTFVSCIDSKVENLTKFYGRFQLGPFAPGQALTVANALRRSLLSQLSGLSITLFEIQGASNEYEVLPGVRESVLDILLNLKQIILTSEFEVLNPQVGFLTVKGPGIVRSSDLKLPAFISVVDPHQYIATLSNSGRLTLKFLICSGKNYITFNSFSSQYKKWLVLLQQAQPFTSNFISNKEEKFDQKLEKPVSKNLNKYSADFYKQWKSERNLVNKTKFETFKEIKTTLNSEVNQNFQNTKSSRLKVVQADKKQNFSVEANLFLNSTKLEKTSKISNKTLRSKQGCGSKVGFFPIDAVFMPVTRVNYLIESNDFVEFSEKLTSRKERIVLEIWTNGSIHPRHAIHKASKSLIQLFLPLQQMRTIFLNPFSLAFNANKQKKENFKNNSLRVVAKNFSSISSKKASNEKNQTINTRDFDKYNQILQLDIGNLDLTSRPYSCLKMASIHTISDLISYTKKDLLNIKNFGQRSLVEVEEALQKIKLNLK
uniref:DNA-directed RNA polymerase subunit alpha n=1 Tax=Rhexinema sarcinoideum TaxID=43261 RepID=A0A1B2RYP5_9CHLO|nr:alpha subunit of RNA polymerase [Rhexinema sarcinoideum]